MVRRRYDPDGDLADLQRVWREVGWVDEDEQQHLEAFLDGADVRVAELEGAVEVGVSVHDGRMRVATADLPLAVVSSVTASPIARREGLASLLTAEQLVAAAERGDAIALLGMFDQGYYDRLGFGTGATAERRRFDPATLTVDLPDRRCVRVGIDQADDVHALLERRARAHGAITVDAPGFVRAELGWSGTPLALGFRDPGDDRLTAVVAGELTDESGPWNVSVFLAEEPAGLVELLGLVRQVADQVRMVTLPDPPELLVEDVLATPWRHRSTTRGATHPAEVRGSTWWQARVLDVAAVVGAVSSPGEPVVVRLEVDDPLLDRVGWRGCHGSWRLELAVTSSATRDPGDGLPTVRAGVGALTRLLLGVAPATTLALTDQLSGPADVLAALDTAIVHHGPNPGMYV